MASDATITSEAPLDREAAGAGQDKLQLRMWLRLLTCVQLIENSVRVRLRAEFDTTLPRFDVLAQLDATGSALSMGELSARLMVTSGNVTGLVDAMEIEGLVTRQPHPTDRRSTLIAMTPQGRELFAQMAPTHAKWIDTLMAGLTHAEAARLMELLGKLKSSVRVAE